MSSSKNKDAERRAEAAFAQQQAVLNQQAQFLSEQSATAQHVRDLLSQAEAGNAEAAELAQQALNDAIAGNPTQAQLDYEDEARLRVAEELRRAGVTPESSPGAIRLGELEEAIIASRDARRQGDIGAAVGAIGATQGTVSSNLEQQLSAAMNPLVGSQALSQSAVNLGRLSQYNVPPNPIYQDLRNIGGSAITALGSTPNFFSNIGSNLSSIRGGINSIFGRGGSSVPTGTPVQNPGFLNAFNTPSTAFSAGQSGVSSAGYQALKNLGLVP